MVRKSQENELVSLTFLSLTFLLVNGSTFPIVVRDRYPLWIDRLLMLKSVRSSCNPC